MASDGLVGPFEVATQHAASPGSRPALTDVAADPVSIADCQITRRTDIGGGAESLPSGNKAGCLGRNSPGLGGRERAEADQDKKDKGGPFHLLRLPPREPPADIFSSCCLAEQLERPILVDDLDAEIFGLGPL